MAELTETEFDDMVDALFYENPDQDILGEDANTFGIDMADSLCPKDSPLPMVYGYISNNMLTAKAIQVNHELGTWFPRLIMFDEEMRKIGFEHYQLQADDINNSTITFFRNIPYNRFYRYILYRTDF